ncbi:hypothetical protein HGI16_05935 [Brevibacterium casei]|uniref:hypothetical protein n=1 Tax=Brevibacterium casei TaxID=33889 RepID=UPI00186BAC41|nr:hypothetical protein [Brevibacterium casei]MBE4694242.1 hypothetical protein [Brevibacterium casei]MBY3577365.1 hypothetical protein [Brevibacterium casei]
MRPLLLITSTLSDGRPWRLILWPLAASLAVFILVLAILAPALARAERSAAAGPAPESTSADPPPAVDAVPSYSVAVGIDDTVSEMPALQSAKVDFLSFSAEYFSRLKEGAKVEEFGTEERELSPAGARSQVEDGTSVLAVILPKQLTPTVIDDIRAYSAGEIDTAPTYAITIVAGPQALNEDRFIVEKYETAVMRQATEFVSDQIRNIAGKITCDPTGLAADCARSQDETATAFERPFTTEVEEVSGPAPVDSFTTDDDATPGDAASSPAPEPAGAGEGADESGTEPVTNEQAAAASAPFWTAQSWVPTVLIALAVAAVTLALAASFTVNRAAGLSLVLVGPWRTLRTQRPFPRQALLRVKLVIGAVGTVVLGLLASAAVTGFGTAAVYGVGAYPLLRILAVLCFLTLLTAALVTLVLAVGDTAGTLFGSLAAIAAVIWAIAESGAVRAVSVSGTDFDLGMVTDLLIGQGNRWMFLSYALPTCVGLLFVFVASLVVGLTATAVYDRSRSTKIDIG